MPGKYQPDIGYSLWLVPPKSHIQYAVLSTLIAEKLPQLFHFPAPSNEHDYPTFFPHVTLTSAIPKGVVGDDPETWLEKLELPDASEAEVRYKRVDVGNRFFKKVFIRCEKPPLENLARLCRLQGVLGSRDEQGQEGKEARRWAELEYDPHASVLYANIDVDEQKRIEVETLLQETRDEIMKLPQYQRQTGLDGWKGGIVWLVPTFLNIEEWKPVAVRVLK